MDREHVLRLLDRERRSLAYARTSIDVQPVLTRARAADGSHHTIIFSSLPAADAEAIIDREIEHHRRRGVPFEWKSGTSPSESSERTTPSRPTSWRRRWRLVRHSTGVHRMRRGRARQHRTALHASRQRVRRALRRWDAFFPSRPGFLPRPGCRPRARRHRRWRPLSAGRCPADEPRDSPAARLRVAHRHLAVPLAAVRGATGDPPGTRDTPPRARRAPPRAAA
jgi:hypothetical protein